MLWYHGKGTRRKAANGEAWEISALATFGQMIYTLSKMEIVIKNFPRVSIAGQVPTLRGRWVEDDLRRLCSGLRKLDDVTIAAALAATTEGTLEAHLCKGVETTRQQE